MHDASSKQQTKQKYKPNHQQTRLPSHSALPNRKWKWKWSRSVVSDSLWPHGHQAPLSMGFSRQDPGVGCHFLLQGTSQPRDRTQVSCIVDRHFTIWATREVKQRKNKQTNKNSAQISSYKMLTQTIGPNLGGKKTKGRKNSTLKPGKRRHQTQQVKK